MGTSIRAVVDPSCISRSAWDTVFEESVTVLRRWPDPPIRTAPYEVGGVELVAYCRDVVDEEGWQICGDARSRLVGDSIRLPRQLGVEVARQPASDLLLRILASLRPPHRSGELRTLLGHDTHGKPYQQLVLAVAILLEHRLPHAVFVSGDFTVEEAERARARLQAILGEEIGLPSCTQPARLSARLQPHLSPTLLVDAIRSLSCRGSIAGVIIGLLSGSVGSPGARTRHEIERAVSCTDLRPLDALTLEAFEFMVGQAKAMFAPSCPDPSDVPPDDQGDDDDDDDTRFPDELLTLDALQLLVVIARGTQSTGLRLTEMAWHDIQRASKDELRLLAMLATHPPTGPVARHLRRAVFESVEIRRLCVETWFIVPPISPLDHPAQSRLFEEAR